MLIVSKVIADLLQRKKRPDDPDMTATALLAAEQALREAESALSSEQGRHDDLVVAALAVGDQSGVEKAARALAEAQQRVTLARATVGAVRKRHEAAVGDAQAAQTASQWSAARACADRRREALARLDEALVAAAAAILEVNAASAQTLAALPVRAKRPPEGWSVEDLDTLLHVRLSTLTGGAIRSGTPWTPAQLSAQSGLIARHDDGVVMLFAAATDQVKKQRGAA